MYVYVHNDGWELGDMSPVEYGQRLMDVPQDNGHSNILVTHSELVPVINLFSSFEQQAQNCTKCRSVKYRICKQDFLLFRLIYNLAKW